MSLSVETLKNIESGLGEHGEVYVGNEQGFSSFLTTTCLIAIRELIALKEAEPVAWISTTQCIGPEHGKERFDKLPVQSLQAGYYKHTPLIRKPE